MCKRTCLPPMDILDKLYTHVHITYTSHDLHMTSTGVHPSVTLVKTPIIILKGHKGVCGRCVPMSSTTKTLYSASISMYIALISMYRASISMYSASISMYIALISMYIASISMYRASISMYRASISIYRASISMYSASISMEHFCASL